MTRIDQPADVVTFLKSQHEQIKSMFEQVSSASGSERETAWEQLRRLLAVHETAEEEIVHPRARHAVANGESVVDARLAEEHESKEMIAALEKLDVSSTEFEQKFAELRSAVTEHAQAEEQTEFDGLAEALSDEQLQGMRRAVQIAEATAPTHPHPGVESAKANLVAGPFAAMLDRARDLIHGRS